LSFTFKKEERLKSKTAIDELFEPHSEEVYVYPLKVKFIIKETEKPLPQTGIIVPKRKFKNAVDRNLLKRRIREAYRLNNQELKKACIANQKGIHLMFLYMSSHTEDFHKIQKGMARLLLSILNKITNVE
jgi:ribonuclease P protein component